MGKFYNSNISKMSLFLNLFLFSPLRGLRGYQKEEVTTTNLFLLFAILTPHKTENSQNQPITCREVFKYMGVKRFTTNIGVLSSFIFRFLIGQSFSRVGNFVSKRERLRLFLNGYFCLPIENPVSDRTSLLP